MRWLDETEASVMNGSCGDKLYPRGHAIYSVCERLYQRGLLSFNAVIEDGKSINRTQKTPLFLLIDRALKEVSISIGE